MNFLALKANLAQSRQQLEETRHALKIIAEQNMQMATRMNGQIVCLMMLLRKIKQTELQSQKSVEQRAVSKATVGPMDSCEIELSQEERELCELMIRTSGVETVVLDNGKGGLMMRIVEKPQTPEGVAAAEAVDMPTENTSVVAATESDLKRMTSDPMQEARRIHLAAK